MKDRKSTLGVVSVALATGLVGLGIGTTISFADDKAHAAGGHGARGAAGGRAASHAAANAPDPHAYEETMKHHVQMTHGAEGAATTKEMMQLMGAHQYLLGDMVDSDDVKKLAATPEMKHAIAEVRAALQEHKTRDRKKSEVANGVERGAQAVAGVAGGRPPRR